MKARFVSEALDFEREGSPHERLQIGKNRFRPYPQMSIPEFQQWYVEEVLPYYDEDPAFDGILDSAMNDENSTDEELIAAWESIDANPELIRKVIQMRDYFMDFRYMQGE